jgi:surface protein
MLGCSYVIPARVNLPGQSGGGGTEDAFIMKVQTDISTPSSFKSNDDQFQIVVFTGTGGGTFDYNVDWGDGNTDSNVTGNITHTYASIGTYDVKITGSFPNIYFFNRYDRHKVLEIKNWGTGEWEYMRNAFYGCTNMVITATDQPDFSRINNFYRAFTGCTNMTLPSPDYTANWVTSNCIGIESMFSNCDSITSLDCSGWDVSNVVFFQYCFTQMDNITEIDMTGWDTTSGSNFYQMFYLSRNLTSLPGIEDFRFRTSGIVDLQFMFRDLRVFYGNNNDGVFDLSGWNITSTNVANIRNMFRNMYEIKRIDMSTWDMSSVTNLSYMFTLCYDLETINGIENWDVSSCTNFAGIFQGCRNLDANVSSWDTSSGTNFNSALNSLSILDTQRITGWSNWDVSNSNTAATTAGSLAYMIAFSTGNSLLSDGFPSNWNIGNATSLWYSFRRSRFGQTNIACNITTTSGLTHCFATFMEIGRYGADSITFNSNFNVSGVTDARYMFASNSQPISAEFGVSFPSGTDWGSVTTFQNFLTNTTLSSADYNALLIDIEASNQNNNVLFDAALCVATGAGVTARNALINDHSWTINDSTP